MKILILTMVSCICLLNPSVYAAEPGDEDQKGGVGAAREDSEGEPDAMQREMRPSDTTDGIERGEALAGEVLWFEVAEQRLWLAEQPARGGVQGAVLLLATNPASVNGGEHLATLRQSLPGYGWQTFYLNAPQTGITQEILSTALAEITGFERLLLMCEGAICLDVIDSVPTEILGSVFINVPLADDSTVAPPDLGRWRNMTAPGLILQEHPQSWPPAVELAEDVELHLLPMGRRDLQNSRVLRKVRGWLKRRLKVG